MMRRELVSHLYSSTFVFSVFLSIANLQAQHCHPEPAVFGEGVFEAIDRAKIKALVDELASADTEKFDEIAQELQELGAVAITPLTDAMMSESPELRSGAARALANFGQPAVAALSSLLSTAPSSDTRLNAAWALGLIGPKAAGAVDALRLKGLKDSSRDVRVRSAYSLGKIGHHASASIPDLMAMADDTDPLVRNSAIYGIAGIKHKPEVVVPFLMGALTDFAPTVKNAAIYALGEYGADSEVALPVLIEMSEKHPDPDVRADAKMAMAKISERVLQRREGRRSIIMMID